jgi:hypothetical protein
MFTFPPFRSEEWLAEIVRSPYFPPSMLATTDLTPQYMSSNPTAALYKSKMDETKRQIKRALFRHAIFKIQNVEVVAKCDKDRVLLEIESVAGSPNHWVDWLGVTGDDQKFVSEEKWTLDRCGKRIDYFVRFYKEGGDGFSTRVVPGNWIDRVRLIRYYFT